MERSTRWLVRANPNDDIAQTDPHFQPGGRQMPLGAAGRARGLRPRAFDRERRLVGGRRPAELARLVAGMPECSPFDIVEVAAATDSDPGAVLGIYFRLGSRLDLNWLRERVLELPRTTAGGASPGGAPRRPYNLYRELTHEVLETGGANAEPRRDRRLVGAQPGGGRARAGDGGDINASRLYDNTTLPVALREVRSLLRGTSRTGQLVGSVTMGE